jgi:hypothetical protein
MNYQLLRSSICAILSLSNQNLPALDSEYLALIVIGNSAWCFPLCAYFLFSQNWAYAGYDYDTYLWNGAEGLGREIEELFVWKIPKSIFFLLVAFWIGVNWII